MPLVLFKTRATAIIAACVALLALVLLVATHDTPGRAHAQATAPDNDNFTMARHIEAVLSPPGADGLPSDHIESTAAATLEAGERADCASIGATVWFAFQAERPMRLRVDTAGSDFDTVL